MNKIIPVIPAKGHNFRFSHRSQNIIAAVSCYSCIIPLIVMDVFLWQFQNLYFRAFDIPLLERKKYVILDRFQL
jgi:hypothetical protein